MSYIAAATNTAHNSNSDSRMSNANISNQFKFQFHSTFSDIIIILLIAIIITTTFTIVIDVVCFSLSLSLCVCHILFQRANEIYVKCRVARTLHVHSSINAAEIYRYTYMAIYLLWLWSSSHSNIRTFVVRPFVFILSHLFIFSCTP